MKGRADEKPKPKSALLTLLMGTCDPKSPLFALRLFRKTLVPIIWRLVDYFVRSHLRAEISAVSLTRQGRYLSRSWPKPGSVSQNVNMMPFRTHDRDSLPKELHQYWLLISSCVSDAADVEDIAYLSVHESFVAKGASQRRGGLHIETPGAVQDTELGETYTVGWGMGERRMNRLHGGIFFGSNVEDSCAIWPKWVVTDPQDPGVVGAGGSCEHLREYLGPPVLIRAGEVYWMTDRTPHEALAQESAGWRQFFRLVVGRVTLWYSKHNTANPLCPLPVDVRVIHEDKFAASLK
jgi:hypothetical protein